MRDSILTKDDIGTLDHERTIAAGEVQSMVFVEGDLPPIFDPDAPKHDQLIAGETVTRNYNKSELKERLEEANLNSDGKVDALRKRAADANIAIKETTGKIIPGYVGKPKGAAQIACERGFIDLSGNMVNGKKYSMNGKSMKDEVTGVVTIDTTTSII